MPHITVVQATAQLTDKDNPFARPPFSIHPPTQVQTNEGSTISYIENTTLPNTRNSDTNWCSVRQTCGAALVIVTSMSPCHSRTACLYSSWSMLIQAIHAMPVSSLPPQITHARTDRLSYPNTLGHGTLCQRLTDPDDDHLI